MVFALEIKDLRKRFGRRMALDGLNLRVPKGVVAAFVGSNGAGKTTTFSLVGGFFQPNSGEIRVCGYPLKYYRRQGGVIGLLPQDALFAETATLFRQLFLTARLSGLGVRAAQADASRVLELVKLADRSNAVPGELSHGMKVRFGMAQALAGNPPLVLLDEPTAGLDPKMLASFRDTIKEIQGSTTIVISSHDLSQLEQVCNYLCIIDQGKVVREGPMAEILEESSVVRYRLDKEIAGLEELKRALPQFSFLTPEARVLSVKFDPKNSNVPSVNAKVLGYLAAIGVGVLEIESRKTLEQSYFEHTDR